VEAERDRDLWGRSGADFINFSMKRALMRCERMTIISSDPNHTNSTFHRTTDLLRHPLSRWAPRRSGSDGGRQRAATILPSPIKAGGSKLAVNEYRDHCGKLKKIPGSRDL
jgi:hypothetical protein